jgi:hypothetical protein
MSIQALALRRVPVWGCWSSDAPKVTASTLCSPALRMCRRIMISASSRIPVLDRIKDAFMLDKRPGLQSNVVAGAAIESQRRVELIAPILSQERVSTRPCDPKVEILISGTQRMDPMSKQLGACARRAGQSLSK